MHSETGGVGSSMYGVNGWARPLGAALLVRHCAGERGVRQDYASQIGWKRDPAGTLPLCRWMWQMKVSGDGLEGTGLTLHCLDAAEIADIKAKVEGAHGRVAVHHVSVNCAFFLL